MTVTSNYPPNFMETRIHSLVGITRRRLSFLILRFRSRQSPPAQLSSLAKDMSAIPDRIEARDNKAEKQPD